MEFIISRRYAQALFHLAQKAKKIERVHQDLKMISQLLEESEDFRNFIGNPVIPSAKRSEILLSIFKKKCDAITITFLTFLDHKGRLGILAHLCMDFERLCYDSLKKTKVKITSSAKLNQHQVRSISHHLKLKLRKDIEPDVEVDEDLIGGIKIRVEDKIYDYSVKAQLQKFKKNLIGT